MDSFSQRFAGLKRPAEIQDLFGRQGPGWQLLDRAQGNAVGLTKGPVDRSGLRHAQLRVIEDEGGDVARMGVAVTDKAPTPGRLVDGGPEDPEVLRRPAERHDGLGMNADAVILLGDSEQVGMTDVLGRLQSVSTVRRIFSGNRLLRVHPSLQHGAARKASLIGYVQSRIVRPVMLNSIFI